MIQTVTLERAVATDAHTSPEPVGQLLSHLPELLRESVSMAFLLRSKRRGVRAPWLAAVADLGIIDVTSLQGTVVRLEVPRLGDAASRLYEAGESWPGTPEPGDTALDVLADVLADVARRNENSERFDQPLLSSLGALRTVLDGGYGRVLFTGERYPAERPATVDRRTLDLAKSLYRKTPASTRVRVVGELVAADLDTGRLTIRLDDGHAVNAVLPSTEFHSWVHHWFGRRVLISGAAVFCPSGRLLLLDADALSDGTSEPSMWSQVPAPRQRTKGIPGLRRRQGPQSGLAAIIGKWPGDESDAEVEAALQDIS